ncbi:MAG: cache domain-containing protein [Proteobacteria bacterium]|nr:cache domain-containing protein [Pseudomonadota bacterium]MBU1059109.1 cache domain-containing protein [Pseudomonadota bacterium]
MSDNNVNNLKEMARIVIPALVAVSLFIFSSFYLFIPSYEKSLLEDRKQISKELVQSSWYVIQHFDQEVNTGTFSLEEAQGIAAHILKSVRYGDDNKNYFWISDFTPTLIMHPYRPDLEGTDMSNFVDPSGTKVLMEFIKKVRKDEEGYIPYMWQWMDDPSKIVPKLSFIKEYKPWGWIIGTGIYLEDVQSEIALMTKKLLIASVTILFFVFLLAWYQIYLAVKALKLRQEVLADLEFKNLILSTQQETSLDGIMVVNKNGKIISHNQRFLTMWGISEEVSASKNDTLVLQAILEKLVEPEHYLQQVRYLYKHQNEKSLDEIILKDEQVFNRYSSPMFGPDGGYLGRVWYFRDISYQKQAEGEKNALETQLRQAQKMEAIGTLAGGIAHDFNNILTPILGYSEMALDDLPPDSPAVSDILEVVSAANRAKELIFQILTFSRQTEQEWKPFKIQPVLKEALKLLRGSIPSTIKIEQQIDPQCGPIFSNPTQVHQIIMNLCTNAFYAMKKTGGVLSVSLDQVELGSKELGSTINLDPGPYVRLEVSDNGVGMDRVTMEKIFEPYFTTKPMGKGTGLGLSVVHGIIKLCKGGITVTSTPGLGTTFHLYFPVVEEKKHAPENDSNAQIPTGHERIMLVDDEEIIVKMGKQMLEKLGYQVSDFTNSEEALQAFVNAPESFDLLITDLTMPGLTGIQLATEIMQLRAELPVILCSGFSETMSGNKAKSVGIREYVMKPMIKKDLAQIIRKVMDTKEQQVD